MTTELGGAQVASMIEAIAPGSVTAHDRGAAWIKPGSWPAVARGLHDRPEADFRFLNAVTGVDYIDHFEVIYHLTSLTHNHMGVEIGRASCRERV